MTSLFATDAAATMKRRRHMDIGAVEIWAGFVVAWTVLTAAMIAI